MKSKSAKNFKCTSKFIFIFLSIFFHVHDRHHYVKSGVLNTRPAKCICDARDYLYKWWIVIFKNDKILFSKYNKFWVIKPKFAICSKIDQRWGLS